MTAIFCSVSAARRIFWPARSGCPLGRSARCADSQANISSTRGLLFSWRTTRRISAGLPLKHPGFAVARGRHNDAVQGDVERESLGLPFRPRACFIEQGERVAVNVLAAWWPDPAHGERRRLAFEHAAQMQDFEELVHGDAPHPQYAPRQPFQPPFAFQPPHRFAQRRAEEAESDGHQPLGDRLVGWQSVGQQHLMQMRIGAGPGRCCHGSARRAMPSPPDSGAVPPTARSDGTL